MDPEMVKTLKLVDIGDILGFYGSIRRTPRGELSIKAKLFKMLSKSLLPLPNKQISEEKLEQLKMYHTMSDTETKYRQRYVDLIVNERTRDTFRKRSLIIQKLENISIIKDLLRLKPLCFTLRHRELMQDRL